MRVLRQTTTFEIRLEIGDQASVGLNDAQIASVVGCSVWTVRKWRRRSKPQGRIRLTSHMGRPARGPGSTFPTEVTERLLHLRKLHPGWGPDSLLTALEMDPGFAAHPLPSRAQLARLLKHAGWTRRDPPHHDLMQPAQSLLTDPHQEWQMDAQGVMRVDGVGKVSLIRIVDVTSRLKAERYPSLDTSNPALPDYQLTLRRAFLTYGLPHTLTLDHGTVFYDNKTPSPFPTRLHVWLIALGVQVRFTRHPLSHRSRDHRAHSSDVDGSGAVGTGLSFSLRFMGGTGCTARRARVRMCPVGLSPTNPRSKPIRKPFTRGAFIDRSGKKSSCHWKRCLPSWPNADGFAASAPMAALSWEAITTLWATALPAAASPLALILITLPCSVNPKEVKRRCNSLSRVSPRRS